MDWPKKCLHSSVDPGIKANSHRHAIHDKTFLSVSRPLRRCELDSRQLKTVADGKFEVWTRSEQWSNSHQHTRHDTHRTVLSCLAGGVNWALGWNAGVHDSSPVYMSALVSRRRDRMKERKHCSDWQFNWTHSVVLLTNQAKYRTNVGRVLRIAV